MFNNNFYSIDGIYNKNKKIIEHLDEPAPSSVPIFNFRIGDLGHGEDMPAIANIENSNITDYAMAQKSDGSTILNTKPGKSIHFREGDIDQMVLKNGKLGIGVDTPITKIHVDGEITANDFIDSDGIVTAREKLCIADTCLTEEELLRMKTRPAEVSVPSDGNISSTELENQLSTILADIENLKQEMRESSGAPVELNEQVRALDIKITTLETSISNVRERLGNPEEINESILSLNRDLNDLRDIVSNGVSSQDLDDKLGEITIDLNRVKLAVDSGNTIPVENQVRLDQIETKLATIETRSNEESEPINMPDFTNYEFSPDGNFTLGPQNERLKFGAVGHTNWAGLAQRDNFNRDSYALIQHKDGRTILNSKGGKDLHIRQGNSDRIKIDSSGQVNVTNKLTVGSGNEILKVGNVGHNSWPGLAQKDNFNRDSYALIQHKDGRTILNSKGGKDLHIRQGNSDRIKIDSSGQVHVTNKLTGKNGMDIQGGRSYFKDSENRGRVRVGAAWGIPGLYSEDNQDIVVGVSSSKTAHIGNNGKYLSVSGATGDVNIKGKLCMNENCLEENHIKNLSKNNINPQNLTSTSNNKLNLSQVQQFNNTARNLPVPFYMEYTSNQASPYNKVIYKRLTPIGNWNFFRLLHYDWFSNKSIEGKAITNKMNTDFKLFSNLDDAKNDINAWKFCNYDDPGVGFPRDCGINKAVGSKWISYYPGQNSRGNREFNWKLVNFSNDDLINAKSICIGDTCIENESMLKGLINLLGDRDLYVVKNAGYDDYQFTPTNARYVRIYPQSWHGHMSLRFDVYVDGVLQNNPENKRKYSSVWSGEAPGSGHARSIINSAQAWSAQNNRVGEWAQVDLGSVKNVTGFKIQGRGNNYQYIKSFKLQYSTDGSNFSPLNKY